MRGLNLYQFEKIDYFGFEEKTWYNITDEAEECYRDTYHVSRVRYLNRMSKYALTNYL